MNITDREEAYLETKGCGEFQTDIGLGVLYGNLSEFFGERVAFLADTLHSLNKKIQEFGWNVDLAKNLVFKREWTKRKDCYQKSLTVAELDLIDEIGSENMSQCAYAILEHRFPNIKFRLVDEKIWCECHPTNVSSEPYEEYLSLTCTEVIQNMVWSAQIQWHLKKGKFD